MTVSRTEPLSVGAVAALAGVTVRTLHHYDERGLLVPGHRSGTGQRGYTEADVARLQRILFNRELGFQLDHIARLIDDPDVDEREHLRRQHGLLDEQIERLARVRDAVRTTLEAHEMSIDLTAAERLEVFGTDDPSQYEAEAHERWGGSEAYAESERRTRRYGKEEWLAIRAENEAIEADFAIAMAAGEAVDHTVAMAIAERARAHVDRWYYRLGHEGHRGLAELYVSDARFRAHYDDRAPGLAQYVHDAIHANADHHGPDVR